MAKFGSDEDYHTLCKKRLSTEDMQTLKDAIENSYFFELFVEDLPMYGFIGDIENEDYIQKDITGSDQGKFLLFTHLDFHFGMNKGKIVSAAIYTDKTRAVDITDTKIPKEIEFTYSIKWTEESLEWKHRMKNYANNAFSQPRSTEIHWLSIINSCVLVVLLMAFLAIIFMRVLKNDFARYIDIEEDTIEEEEVSFANEFITNVVEILLLLTIFYSVPSLDGN